MDKHIHIVSFDVPYPADYGGVIDVFYKIVALAEAGWKIHLHCFTRGRKPAAELDKYCVSVHYYARRTGPDSLSSGVPYIVRSRRSRELLKNLSGDRHPVLLEGIHCTYWLYKKKLQDRQVFIRLHNVEHTYYHKLSKTNAGLAKKIYYKLESFLLKRYEKKVSRLAVLLAITTQDKEYFEGFVPNGPVRFLPAFIPWKMIRVEPGKSDYCLYHGNLSVAENEKAVQWLVDRVFSDSPLKLVVAGKAPSKKLTALLKQYDQIMLIADPSEAALQQLITHAQVHVLPSFNETGIKLKLLNALFNGRFCVVNSHSVAGSGLGDACTIAKDANAFRIHISLLLQQEATEENILQRKNILEDRFNNAANIALLNSWIQ